MKKMITFALVLTGVQAAAGFVMYKVMMRPDNLKKMARMSIEVGNELAEEMFEMEEDDD